MTMGCKDTCKNHYKDKCNIQHGWVNKGYIKCVTCGFTIKTQDLRCRCCGYRFRRSVRNSNSLIYYHRVTKARKLLEQQILLDR